MTVRFLGQIQGMLTHYVQGRPKGRSVSCGHETCPPTIHRLKTIWKGYAPVEMARLVERDWYPGVVEITSSLGQQLEGRKLLGEIWDLERIVGDFRHAEEIGVFQRVERPAPIDATKWVETVCFRLYGTRSIKWGAKDPLPPRVRLETRPLSLDPTPPPAAPPPAAPPSAVNGKPRKKMAELFQELRRSSPPPT